MKEKIKYYIKELVKILSDQPSFFSQKRVQIWMAYITFIIGAIYTLIIYVKSVSDFTMWSAPLLLIAGFTLNAVQKEKLANIK